MSTHPKTTGLVAAPVTAFREDGAVDTDSVPAYAEHLRRQGVAGVFVNGTTGEGISLTVEERETLAAAWREALPPAVKLFIHMGCHALPDGRRLAAHAESIGADAIGALTPVFFKPDGLAGTVDWCAALAEAAPGLPFYYYHMPSLTGMHVRVHRFLEAAANRIPNLAGIKFTFEAMDDYRLCLDFAGGAYDILWGRDEMLLGALATGAKGGVGSTYNVAAPLYRSLIDAFGEGDFETARHLQSEACRLIEAMAATGHFCGALKYLLARQGVPVGTALRAPNPTAPEATFAPLDPWIDRLDAFRPVAGA